MSKNSLPLRAILSAGYVPRSFCTEYLEARGSSIQLVQFMAVALGVKKAYDDWFPESSLEKIKTLCKTYGLHCKFDWFFVPAHDVSRVISGGVRLPTTRMFGVPFEERARPDSNAEVHVFISRSKRDLELCFRNGWYPLIVRNRAIHKPYIDHVRFGYFLGYPGCCVDFFRRYNDHVKYNYLFEAWKNTRSRPRLYCNPLLKNFTFSYIFHMPCSYDCAQTLRYVSALRKKLLTREPGLVRRTDEMLAKPVLVLGEKNSYVFEGKVSGSGIAYSDYAFIGSSASPEESLDAALAKGNRVRAEGRRVCVYRGREKLLEREVPFGAFVMQLKD